jgi:hypothetical protein
VYGSHGSFLKLPGINGGNYKNFHSRLSTSRLEITSMNSQANFSNDIPFERFDVLTTVLIDIIIFSDALPFSLVQSSKFLPIADKLLPDSNVLDIFRLSAVTLKTRNS